MKCIIKIRIISGVKGITFGSDEPKTRFGRSSLTETSTLIGTYLWGASSETGLVVGFLRLYSKGGNDKLIIDFFKNYLLEIFSFFV